MNLDSTARHIFIFRRKDSCYEFIFLGENEMFSENKGLRYLRISFLGEKMTFHLGKMQMEWKLSLIFTNYVYFQIKITEKTGFSLQGCDLSLLNKFFKMWTVMFYVSISVKKMQQLPLSSIFLEFRHSFSLSIITVTRWNMNCRSL